MDLPRALASYAEEAARLVVIDNDSARFALIGMYSPSQASTEILEAIATQELALQTLSWCARVASLANIGDGPSRLAFEEAEQLGLVRIDVDISSKQCCGPLGIKHVL